MDLAVDSCRAEARTGLSTHHALDPAAIPAAVHRSRGDAGPALEQNGEVGKMEAGGRFGTVVPGEFSGRAMAVCKLFDVARRAELVLWDGVFCVLRSGGFFLRPIQVPSR